MSGKPYRGKRYFARKLTNGYGIYKKNIKGSGHQMVDKVPQNKVKPLLEILNGTPKKNPATSKKLNQAIDSYIAFRDENPESVQEIDLDDLSLLWLMGDVVAIEYLTSRSGVGEYYRHDFSDKAMPALLVTPNGKNVLLVGTDFEVNERGFVDDK